MRILVLHQNILVNPDGFMYATRTIDALDLLLAAAGPFNKKTTATDYLYGSWHNQQKAYEYVRDNRDDLMDVKGMHFAVDVILEQDLPAELQETPKQKRVELWT